jgi:hypothetical protein
MASLLHFMFIQDENDGHWYKIPVSLKESFYDWQESMYTESEWLGCDFDKYRCMHPCNYMFKEIEVLKEN